MKGKLQVGLILLTAVAVTVGVLSACGAGSTSAPPSVGSSESGDSNRTADLTVKVTGVRNTNGKIGVSLFASPDGFPGEWRKAESNILQAIEGDQVVVVFEGLAPGRYAVSVLHDEDENGELNTNAIGIPNEGYGVSNDAVNTFGPPDFDEAVIELKGTAELSVPLHY